MDILPNYDVFLEMTTRYYRMDTHFSTSSIFLDGNLTYWERKRSL